MDQELFELCKSVYNRTQWGMYEAFHRKYVGSTEDAKLVYSGETRPDPDVCPLYTSDYLLQKLPKTVSFRPLSPEWLRLEPITDDQWAASYGKTGNKDEWADSPVKALLKLTVALHEAGELS